MIPMRAVIGGASSSVKVLSSRAAKKITAALLDRDAEAVEQPDGHHRLHGEPAPEGVDGEQAREAEHRASRLP